MERETCLVPYSIMKRDTKLPSLYVVGKIKLFAAAYNYTGFDNDRKYNNDRNTITAFRDEKDITFRFLLSL
jgi:hypothetical protein